MNLGQIGENLVAKKYEALGFKIIARNLNVHLSKQVGEIDIVVANELNKELVFVEVKTRKSYKFGKPSDAVSINKQRKLLKAGKLFLLQRPQYDNWFCRFDVAEVHIDNFENPVIILMNVIEDTY